CIGATRHSGRRVRGIAPARRLRPVHLRTLQAGGSAGLRHTWPARTAPWLGVAQPAACTGIRLFARLKRGRRAAVFGHGGAESPDAAHITPGEGYLRPARLAWCTPRSGERPP